ALNYVADVCRSDCRSTRAADGEGPSHRDHELRDPARSRQLLEGNVHLGLYRGPNGALLHNVARNSDNRDRLGKASVLAEVNPSADAIHTSQPRLYEGMTDQPHQLITGAVAARETTSSQKRNAHGVQISRTDRNEPDWGMLFVQVARNRKVSGD